MTKESPLLGTMFDSKEKPTDMSWSLDCSLRRIAITRMANRKQDVRLMVFNILKDEPRPRAKDMELAVQDENPILSGLNFESFAINLAGRV
jgi:hypothetical protein